MPPLRFLSEAPREEMAEQRILSRDWVHEAKDQYKDELHNIETDLGECMQECCRRCEAPMLSLLDCLLE